jgi:hypothetical protein
MKKIIAIITILMLVAFAGFSQVYKLGDDVKNTSGMVYGHVIYIDGNTVYVACNTYKVNRMRWAGERYDNIETANIYCKNLTYGGFNDWFLPDPTTIFSMRTLMMAHHELMLWYDNRDGQPYWTSLSTIYAAYGIFIYKYQGGFFDKEMDIFNVLPVRKIIQ